MLVFVLAAFASGVLAWTAPASLFDASVARKVLATAQTVRNPPNYPSITSTSGVWQWGSPDNWITGFFPSTLYQMQKRECLCPGSTGGAPWLSLARMWSAAIPQLHWKNHQGHDVGFISWPFAEEYSLGRSNATASQNIVEFALELSSRFNSAVGCTRSWDGSAPGSSSSTDFLVIIDNLMNLETLLQAYHLTDNHTFYDVAVAHADTTLKNHFRSDWGSWHVVNYDSKTGAVKKKYTAQGYSDSSTWSRGESWAIYGYAKMFQYTYDQKYLNAARNIAGYFLRRAPAAYMPWDFDAPASPTPPADSSAAMIAAAGLQVLAAIETDLNNATGVLKWTNGAQMLITQTASYALKSSWQSLLSNGTRDNHGTPHSNNTGLPYADYFWIKNGNFLLASGQTACPNGKAANATGCGIDLVGPAF